MSRLNNNKIEIAVQRTQMERLLAAIDQEDWETLSSLFSKDIRYEVPGRPPIQGLAELVHYYTVDRDVVNGRHEVSGVLVDGQHAMTWGTFHATTRSGASINVRFADLCHFDGSLIDSRIVYFFAAPQSVY